MPAHTCPNLSIIVAARNASTTLGQCLQAICAQAGNDTEVIVVDDWSTDDTALAAARFPVEVLSLESHLGAAGARNVGASRARSGLLCFVDADVVIGPRTLARARDMMRDPEIDAVFGAYDSQPASRSIVSLFKNLSHHYHHHRWAGRAETFWTGFGLIRKDRFMSVGGFDEERFKLPAIEDVALGMRLTEKGARIVLCADLEVKHLKHWTLASLVRTDIAQRAVPWTVFCLENARFPNVLNLSVQQRLGALLCYALLATAVGSMLEPALAPLTLALLVACVVANWGLYRVLYGGGGALLAVCGFGLQQLYYLYSLAGLLIGFGVYVHRRHWRSRRHRDEQPLMRADAEAGGIDGK